MGNNLNSGKVPLKKQNQRKLNMGKDEIKCENKHGYLNYREDM